MKQGTLFVTIFIPLVVIALLFATRKDEQPTSEPQCKKVERIPVTATMHFDYCIETDKVRYDTTWIEPGRFERRRIKMRGL